MPWEPLPDHTRQPTPVAEPLNELMNRLSGASLSTIELVMESWESIVGADVAASTAPVKIADGCLTVRTDDPIWSTEVRWLEPAIIERIANLAGGTALRRVKVVVARQG